MSTRECEINDKNEGKTTDVLFPAAQLIIDKQGELQFELRQNPWKTEQHHRLERQGLAYRRRVSALLSRYRVLWLVITYYGTIGVDCLIEKSNSDCPF
jgi:hypothetical protein